MGTAPLHERPAAVGRTGGLVKTRKIVCLDFDGVLHPTAESRCRLDVTHFGWLPHLKRLLVSHPDVEILIHSTWRHRFNLEELRSLLGDALGPRVAAATPHGDDRWLSIQTWAAEQTAALDLLILDDAPAEFPAPMPFTLVVCNPAQGVSDSCVQQSIQRWLEQQHGRGGDDDDGQ